jgi:catechol 2,3-dioxygenase-like lactoylglutathione lyase family enzyme
MLFDHLGVDVADLAAARAFYDAALRPLRIAIVQEITPEQTGGSAVLGYGKTADSRDIQAGKPSFWIAEGDRATGGIHFAFVAANRAEVDAFHAAALAAGGKDNGAPGPRPHYHPGYYGAFVIDPDGNNVEAVFHGGG